MANAFTNVSTSWEYRSDLWCTLYFLEGLLIIFSNALTLFVFFLNKHLRKRSMYLPLSLSFADMMVGTALVIYAIHMAIYDTPGEPPRWIVSVRFKKAAGFDNFTAAASFLGLVFISLERMTAAVYPLTHRRLTNRSYYLFITVHWATASLTMVAFIFAYGLYLVIAFVVAIWGLITIAVAYISILIKVKQQKAHVLASLTVTQKKERRFAVTLFIVTALSLLTWLPDIIEIALLSNLRFRDPLKILIMNTMFNLFRCANSLVNPIVYVLRLKVFRRALFKMICRFSRSPEPDSINGGLQTQ